MKKILLGLVAIIACACAQAQQYNAGVYNNGMQQQQVQTGVVLAVRPVTIHVQNQNSAMGYVGGGTGAALGAVLGNSVGRGNGRVAAQVALGALGAVAGNMAANAMMNETTVGQEIIIRLESPYPNGPQQTVAITQSGSNLMPGTKVYLVGGYNGTRVVAM